MYDVYKINQIVLGDSAYILSHPYGKISPKVSLLFQTITDTIKYSVGNLWFACYEFTGKYNEFNFIYFTSSSVFKKKS